MGLAWQAPGQRYTVRWDREGQILQLWTVSAPRGDFLSVVQQVLLDSAQAWHWAGESREMQERRLHLTREPRLRCVVKFNNEAKQASISSDPLVKPHLIGSKKKKKKHYYLASIPPLHTPKQINIFPFIDIQLEELEISHESLRPNS